MVRAWGSLPLSLPVGIPNRGPGLIVVDGPSRRSGRVDAMRASFLRTHDGVPVPLALSTVQVTFTDLSEVSFRSAVAARG
jgi:hypothetical protein